MAIGKVKSELLLKQKFDVNKTLLFLALYLSETAQRKHKCDKQGKHLTLYVWMSYYEQQKAGISYYIWWFKQLGIF